MRFLRAAAGALLWILAAVIGLVGAVLCVTVIGLPLGIPLIMLARRLFTRAIRLMLPSHVAHPVKEARSSARDAGGAATRKLKTMSDGAPDLAKARKKTHRSLRTKRKRLRKKRKPLRKKLG